MTAENIPTNPNERAGQPPELPELPELPDPSAEAEQGVGTEADSKMKALERKYPKVLNFASDKFLGTEVARMHAQVQDFEAQKIEAKKGADFPKDVVMGTLEEIDQKQRDQAALEKGVIDKQIEDLKAEIDLRNAALKNLEATGRDEWANKFFGDREQNAAQELQAAIAEESSLKEKGVSDIDDVEGMETRVTAMKQSQRRVRQARKGLQKASDQREYLDLMSKKGE